METQMVAAMAELGSSNLDLQTAGVADSSTVESSVSSYSIGEFEALLEKHDSINRISQDSVVLEGALEPLSKLDSEAASFKEYASRMVNENVDLTPSEIVMLTAKSQEFMFYSNLTANVANRSADGLQQLYRQQG